MIAISQLDRSLSQKELDNLNGSGPILQFLIDRGISAIGGIAGGQIAEKGFGLGGPVADATLTSYVQNPSADFSFDTSVTLTPFGQ